MFKPTSCLINEMSEQFKLCKTCQKEMTVLDDHSECFRHQKCNEAFPCDVCRKWSKEKRSIINKMIDKKIAQMTATSTLTSTSKAVDKSPADPIDGISGQSRKSLARVSSVPTHSPLTAVGTESVDRESNPSLERSLEFLINKKFEEMFSKFPVLNPRTDEIQSDIHVQRQRSDSHYSRVRPSDLNPEPNSDVDDILEVTDGNNNFSDTQSVADSRADHVDDTDSLSVFSDAKVPSPEWKSFINKVKAELGISEKDVEEKSFPTYLSDRLKLNTSEIDHRLPLEGSVLNTLHQVDKEWQSKGRLRAYKAVDDGRLTVSKDHFSQYCTTPRLDENVEEGLVSQTAKKSGTRFKFSNKKDQSRNSDLQRIDASARLMLREVSHASMITSYLDRVVSDDDRTEALQALAIVFQSMADVVSRILVTSVASRRSLYLQDMTFKNSATEKKLSTLSTVNLGMKIIPEKGKRRRNHKVLRITTRSQSTLGKEGITPNLSMIIVGGQKRAVTNTINSRGFVPQTQNSNTRICALSSSERKTAGLCTKLERSDKRQMDFASGPRRTKTAIQGNSKGNRNKVNKFSQFSNEFVYIRRGAHFIRKKCCRSSAQRPRRPGILQYVFCCTEEGRKLPANFESSKLKYTFAGSTFQNGNFEINNGGFEDRRMGFHTGLTRCIPSYSSVSISSSISPVLCTGSSLPVSCNALRPGDSASDFH